MRKLLLSTAALCMTAVFAEAQNAAYMQMQNGVLDKAKTSIDKDMLDPKINTKSKTWYYKGQIYEAIAVDGTGVYSKLDSNAALVAYESYKKGMEVEPNGGKLTKELTEALASQKLYQALMNQGAMKYQAKNFEGAYKMMSLAGNVMPKDTVSPLYSAISAQQGNNLENAKTQFLKYVDNGGKDASVFYSLVMMYKNEKNYDKALGILDRALTTVLPNNKDLQAEKVNIFLSTNRADDAIASLKSIIEKDPTNATNIVNLGILYDNKSGQFDDKIKKLNDSKKKSDNMGKSLKEEKEKIEIFASEIKRLADRQKKEPKNADVKRQIAENTKRMAESKLAVDSLTKQSAKYALEYNPAEIESKTVELKKQKADQLEMAKEMYEKALKADPKSYDALFNLGVFYYNEAVGIKGQVDAMDMKEYQTKGKEIEGRACGRFKKALPYFEQAKLIKEEADLTNNITNLTGIIKQFEERKTICID